MKRNEKLRLDFYQIARLNSKKLMSINGGSTSNDQTVIDTDDESSWACTTSFNEDK